MVWYIYLSRDLDSDLGSVLTYVVYMMLQVFTENRNVAGFLVCLLLVLGQRTTSRAKEVDRILFMALLRLYPFVGAL